MLRNIFRRILNRCRSLLNPLWNQFLDRWMPLLDRPKYQYYNDCHNDRWIAEHVFPGLRGGYFVEAGAANGRDASSCYVLETQLGWSGVCIEPHPRFAQRLRQHRPNSLCLELCLGESEGTEDFLVGPDGRSSYLSGLRTNLQQYKHGAEGILQVGKSVPMPVRTLAQVLDQAGAPAVIDYGAFDIEGSELPVLRGFPFRRYRFRALSIECGDFAQINDLLRPHGYREVKNPYNRSKPWERYWLSD